MASSDAEQNHAAALKKRSRVSNADEAKKAQCLDILEHKYVVLFKKMKMEHNSGE